MCKKVIAALMSGLLILSAVLGGCSGGIKKDIQKENALSGTGLVMQDSDNKTANTNKGQESGHTHSYEEINVVATCLIKGHTRYQCECGYSYSDNYTDIGECSWGYWIVTKFPTLTEEGVKERKCSVCGKTEKEVINKKTKENA